MLKQGILIRDCTSFKGLDEFYIRVAVKTHQENERLIERFQTDSKDSLSRDPCFRLTSHWFVDSALIFALAFLIDLVFGEYPDKIHPTIGIGK